MVKGKPWWKSRTIWTAIALLILNLGGSLELIVQQLETLGWTKETLAQIRLYGTLALSIATVWLRLDTREPIAGGAEK